MPPAPCLARLGICFRIIVTLDSIPHAPVVGTRDAPHRGMTSSAARILAVLLACGLGAACAAKAGTHKSYLLPAVEIVAMDAGVNLAARAVDNPAFYEVSAASIRRNLGHSWVVDDDPFEINQIGHPYQGAMYHDIARSNGLNYWQSMAYTFAGSAFWEIFGETTPPSFNDQISTGIGASFLGEPLFRISRLLLVAGGLNPPALGIAFVIFQAVVVGFLGELQYMALRRINIA